MARSFGSVLNRIQAVSAEQTLLRRRHGTQQITRRLQELERLKRQLGRMIERMVKRFEKVGSVQFPEQLIKRVQDEINAEGWPELIIKRRFDRESTHYRSGARWRPLAASTIRQRIRKGFGARPILQNTGRLRADTINTASDKFRLGTRGGIRFDWKVGSLSTPYAKYVHRVRPFFLQPNKAELRPVMKRIRTRIAAEVRKELRA